MKTLKSPYRIRVVTLCHLSHLPQTDMNEGNKKYDGIDWEEEAEELPQKR